MQFSDGDGSEKKEDLMPLSKAAKIVGYTPEHLNLLCRKGLLCAEKFGRNWYVTQKAIDEYITAKKNDPPVDLERSVLVSVNESENLSGGEQMLTDREILKEEKSNEDLASTECSVGSVKKTTAHVILVNVCAAVAVMVAIGGISLSVWQHDKSKQALGAQQLSLQIVPDVVSAEGLVMGEESVNEKLLAENAGVLASENYQIPGVSFGGDVMVVDDDHGGAKLEIFDVRSENLTSKDKKENKLLVTWRTSKQAISKVTFAKGNGQDERVLKESDFGVAHSIILTGVEPATPYMYQISSRDKWGNEVSTDRFGAYIGAQPESVFELIAKNFSEMFEWTKKK